MNNVGTESIQQDATPVVQLVPPGPVVTIAAPGLFVTLEKLSAAKETACSW